MIEYFAAKEKDNPGKLIIVMNLDDTLLEDIKSKDQQARFVLIDKIAAELDVWINEDE